MKLFEIEITITAIVSANDETHAYAVAMDERREIVSDQGANEINVVREIRPGSTLPDNWNVECYPYGVDERTIAAILADQPPVIEPDTKTGDMFAGVAQ